MAHEIVRRMDTAQEQRQLSDDEMALRKRMKLQCLGLSSMERTMARQRSRLRQLSDGDANTAYFHMIARGRKRKNFIPALAIDGHTVAEHALMEQVLHAHFSNVFGTAPSSGTTLDFSAIGALPLDLGELDNPITDDKTWAAIKDMPSDRAPGPDGFPGAFYKTAWSTIKPQVMDAIQAFCYGNKQ